MNILLVDDEAPAREELAWLIAQCGDDLQVVAHAASAQDALRKLDDEALAIDLAILDINMAGIDGVRLAELWQEREERPLVIFVTAYQDRAVDAFAVDAVDYLLKPVRLERLKRALARARQRQHPALASASAQPRFLSRISVEERGVYRVIPIEEILFFEAEDGIVVVQTARGRHISDFSLKFLEQNLDPHRFFRSHRSTIVQLDAICSIAPWGAGTYRLICDREQDLGVPLARSRAAELKSLIPWSASALDD